MSDSIPLGWEIIKLKDITTQIRDGNYGADYPKAIEMIGAGVPFLTSTVVGNNQKVNLKKLKYISSEKHALLAKAHIKTHDVLFTNRGANVGNVAVVPSVLDDANIGPQLTYLRADKKKVLPNFLYIALQTDFFKEQLVKLDSGSAMNFFGIGTTEKFIFSLPPLPEQQKIAKILTSVDEVIEKTQAQIDKLKDLKTGMMQELLTNGIGHTEFKDSPVGRIPAEWEVKTVEECNVSVLDGDRGKEYPKDKDFLKYGYCLFLSAKNVTKSGFVFKNKVFITKEKDELLRKGKLQRNDLVITTRGTLGNIAHFDDTTPYVHLRINSGMAILRNEGKILTTSYLNILLNAPIIIEQTELLAFGSAIPQLTISLLKNLKVPVPLIKEQLLIVTSIESISNKTNLLINKLTSLENTKKALMQDLLTGKVRVNVEPTA